MFSDVVYFTLRSLYPMSPATGATILAAFVVVAGFAWAIRISWKQGVVGLLTLGLLLMAAPAFASKPVVRPGSDENGYANPNGCIIKDEGSELHVSCLKNAGATGKARIRYRYLAEYGGAFKPAHVDFKWEAHGGRCAKRVTWQVPTPRTLRIVIPLGCYAHIQTVTWSQR